MAYYLDVDDVDIVTLVICAMSILFNGYIIIKEVTKRYRGETQFKSAAMKWISLMAISTGILFFISLSLGYLVVEYFGPRWLVIDNVTMMVSLSQILLVGLYQLLRLYHLFAHNEVWLLWQCIFVLFLISNLYRFP